MDDSIGEELKALLSLLEDEEAAKVLLAEMSDADLEMLRERALRLKNLIYDLLVDKGHFREW